MRAIHTSVRGFPARGPSTALGFYVDRKGCDSAAASASDRVRQGLPDVSCTGDPRGSQSDLLQLPGGPELKSSASSKSFFPLPTSPKRVCSDKNTLLEGSQLLLVLSRSFKPGGDLLKANGFAGEAWYPSSPQPSQHSIVLFWNFNTPPVGLQ